MPARYIANPTYPRQQDAQPETQRALAGIADEIATRAKAKMPRGYMGARFRTRARKTEVFAGSGWHLIEFGSTNSSPRAPFRSAIASLGMKIVKR